MADAPDEPAAVRADLADAPADPAPVPSAAPQIAAWVHDGTVIDIED